MCYKFKKYEKVKTKSSFYLLFSFSRASRCDQLVGYSHLFSWLHSRPSKAVFFRLQAIIGGLGNQLDWDRK